MSTECYFFIMYQRPVFLVLLLFEFIVAERVLRQLDLKDLQPLITANCCPLDNSNQPCIEEQCPIADTQPGNIADGNALTEWVVDFLSNGSNGAAPTATFTLNFGQVSTCGPCAPHLLGGQG